MRGAKTGKGKGEDDQREQGFNQYFSGANKDRAQEKDKDLRVRNKSKHSAISKERKGWIPKPLEQPVQTGVMQVVNKRYSDVDDEDEDTGNKVGPMSYLVEKT
jgi:hypothetical protein